MSSILERFDLTAFLQQQARDVFNTMASLEVQPAPGPNGLATEERITGVVGLGGENITGAVYLHMPIGLAEQITRQMLGMEPADPLEESAVNDVTGELTNMLAGGLKSALCDRGLVCAVSTPTIIRGSSYEIELLPDVQHNILDLTASGQPLQVEVHLKEG
jgi:chemotaxis protein CheX